MSEIIRAATYTAMVLLPIAVIGTFTPLIRRAVRQRDFAALILYGGVVSTALFLLGSVFFV